MPVLLLEFLMLKSNVWTTNFNVNAWLWETILSWGKGVENLQSHLIDVWPPALDIHWCLPLWKCAKMEDPSDTKDPSMKQSGLNQFWYEADVVVCISIHTCMHVQIYKHVHMYLCKRKENEREKTDYEWNRPLTDFVSGQLLNDQLKYTRYQIWLHLALLGVRRIKHFYQDDSYLIKAFV